MAWRGVEMASHSPSAREKHTLTPLSGGRLLMFGGAVFVAAGWVAGWAAGWVCRPHHLHAGRPLMAHAFPGLHPQAAAPAAPTLDCASGTDGQTTLGDSWWLDLEHITQQQPDLISLADLADSSSQPLANATTAPPLPLPAGKQAPAGEGGSVGVAMEAVAGGSGSGQQPSPAQLQQAAAAGSALTGGLAYLQQNLPTISSSMTSALSSLRGRLGMPATASAAALAAQQAAASIAEEHDEALLQLGERLLAAGSANGSAGSAGLPLDARQLVAAARQFFATCSAEQLRLGDLPVLMADYRRLARLGWAEVLRWAALAAVCVWPQGLDWAQAG